MNAFGVRPTADAVAAAISQVREVCSSLPETTCKHRGCCCKAGCPNMRFAEYLNIRTQIDSMADEQKIDLLVRCVRYYLSPQIEEKNGHKVPVAKPCVFLDSENKCTVYAVRPFKCRTYGLVPDDMHRRIVDEVSLEMGAPRHEIPLCIQCPFVKVKPEYADKFPDGKIPEKMIADIETRLKKADNSLGIAKGTQEAGHAYLTFHDWHLMNEMGEEWMAMLTPIRQQKDDAWKDKFVEDLRTALRERTRA